MTKAKAALTRIATASDAAPEPQAVECADGQYRPNWKHEDGRLVFLIAPGTPIIECPKGCGARVCMIRGAVGHFAVEVDAGAGCPTNELYASKHGACVTMYYILENGVPVAKADVKAWNEWMDKNLDQRQLAKDEVNNSTVSTCFLGINHRHGDGAPLLFETLVFDGARDGEQERYTTREAALDGHARMVARVEAGPHVGR